MDININFDRKLTIFLYLVSLKASLIEKLKKNNSFKLDIKISSILNIKIEKK